MIRRPLMGPMVGTNEVRLKCDLENHEAWKELGEIGGGLVNGVFFTGEKCFQNAHDFDCLFT